MEIKYMKKLKSKPLLDEIVTTGFSELEIEAIEKKYNNGKKFPLAFREYLFLGGKICGVPVVYDDFDEIREWCDEEMEYSGNHLDRPFFVFDALDSFYSIFFLDEEEEDPAVYILNSFGEGAGGEPLLKRSANPYKNMQVHTFTTLIDDAIEHVINGWSL